MCNEVAYHWHTHTTAHSVENLISDPFAGGRVWGEGRVEAVGEGTDNGSKHGIWDNISCLLHYHGC
jgi:hypothetical protein